MIEPSTESVSVFNPVDAIITDPTEIDIREHGLDKVLWGYGLSNYTMEKWLMDLIKEVMEAEFEDTSVKWIFNYRHSKGQGDLDGLGYTELPDGRMNVVVSLEMNNFGSCSWIADVRNLSRWRTLEFLAKKGIIKLAPNYIRVHLMAGGHKKQYCLHPEKYNYRLFRMSRMISNKPTRGQNRTLRKIVREIKKRVMALIHPPKSNVYYNVGLGVVVNEIVDRDTTIVNEATVNSCTFLELWRFEGWKFDFQLPKYSNPTSLLGWGHANRSDVQITNSSSGRKGIGPDLLSLWSRVVFGG